jgi:hypothetical protein
MKPIPVHYNRDDNTNPTPGVNIEWSADEMNPVVSEISTIISNAGITLSALDNAQMFKAVNEIIRSSFFFNTNVGSSTGTTYTLSGSPLNTKTTALASWVPGMMITFIAPAPNTGAVVVAHPSITPNATLVSSTGSALVSGDIPANTLITAVVTATNQLQITSNYVPKGLDLQGILANPFASWPTQPFLQAEKTLASGGSMTLRAATSLIMNDGKTLTLPTDITLTIANTSGAATPGGMGTTHVALTGLTATPTRRPYCVIVGQGASGITAVLSSQHATSASSTVVNELPVGYRSRWARLPMLVVGAFTNTTSSIDPFEHAYGETHFFTNLRNTGGAAWALDAPYTIYSGAIGSPTVDVNFPTSLGFKARAIFILAKIDELIASNGHQHLSVSGLFGRVPLLTYENASTATLHPSSSITAKIPVMGDSITVNIIMQNSTVASLQNYVMLTGTVYGTYPGFDL